MLRFAAALAVLLAACAGPSSAESRASAEATLAGECRLSTADQQWLDRAVAAWAYTSREITGLRLPAQFEARIFDARCLLESSSAMAGGPNHWTGTTHDGQIALPGGDRVPAQVVSFASGDDRSGFFVMSTPSVWREGGVKGEPLELGLLMIAVLLHEGSHVAQIPTYGRRMDSLAKRHRLPDSFDDDSIQERFEDNAEFAQSVARETQLLLAAAAAADDAAALGLARQARAAMRARQDRWYIGEDSYLREAEDIWLTMEGSAQWAAYRWLIDPNGAGIEPAAAAAQFGTRGKWWSQKQGFALFMALGRLSRGSWKRHAFGDGAKTGLDMLDDRLELAGRSVFGFSRSTADFAFRR